MAADESHDDKTQTHIVLAKGTTVLHYRIVGKIGAGGMGEVYLAEDTELDRKVALKFLPSHLCQDEDCRKRFKREAQAAAKLSHPNIVTIHEVGEHQARRYFVMEHIEGRSLRDVKAEELDIDRIIGIAIQLCDALHSAHTAGVTHRDIKPSNIIIDSSGRPRLLDFGLAMVKGGEHLTKTGSTLGTVGYMPPEQIEGKETDARSDLFSLGVVLYELIANKSPFRRDDETATLKAILQDTPQPLARYNSNVPDDLQRVITKLLDKDPTLRYQSAAGVIPDLKKLSTSSTTSVAIERKRDRWNRYVVPSALIILLAVLAVWYFGYRDQEPSTTSKDDRIMLAVLPFKNLGSTEDEYFADGVTEEILSRLAAIKDLGVVSSTSSFTYKNTDKTIRQIAEELAVDYVLEGTIRWDKSGEVSVVRVTPQLIQADGDIHLWSRSYDEAITNVFAVQSHIAGQIASVLDIQMTASEEIQVTNVPTENMAAYDYYLRGNNYFEYTSEKSRLNNAIQMYQKAIERDPRFAMAYVKLSMAHTEMIWQAYDISEARYALAEEAIAMASEISPDLPEIHLARGVYYFRGLADYPRGLKELQIASQELPSNTQVILYIGTALRHIGMWEQAESEYKRAIELDPRDTPLLEALAVLLTNLHRYREADSLCDCVLELKPDDAHIYRWKIGLSLFQTGTTDEGRSILNEARERTGEDFPCQSWYLDVYDGRYESALTTLFQSKTWDCTWLTQYDWYVQVGDCFRFLNERDQATVYYDSARILIEIEVSSAGVAMRSWNRACLAYVYAALGRKADALREGRLSVQEWPVSKDAFCGPIKHEWLAKTYTLLGEYDLAVEQLEYLTSIPAGLLPLPFLKSAYFTPLRNHPRFQALIEKYENEYGT
jgi:serine/threonine protein kinase/tetratricopeptide (TPR) repeat protein